MTREDTIASRVARERKRLGFTQAELAKRADVEVWVIEAIEQGRSSGSIDSLLALAKAFGMSVEDLRGGSKSRSTKKA